MPKVLIKAENLCKQFDNIPVVKNLSFEVQEGEFLTLLGPSGCGKTTTLRMIAGFTNPDSGTLELDGKNLTGIPANRRAVNTVFQNYVLFPNLTVKENIAYGLMVKKVSRTEIETRVKEMLELLKLELFANRKPSQLSGGQQQRVAIARCLINQPRVLLLDEPLAALDLQLRRHMQFELKALQRKFATTYIYVTHNQEEALTMSDRIIVMNEGAIEQIGTPEEVYNTPQTMFTARFLGESNIFSGFCTQTPDGTFFSTEGIQIPVPEGKESAVSLSVRPEFLYLSQQKPADPSFEGEITGITFLGNIYRIGIKLKSGKTVYVLARDNKFTEKSRIYITYNREKLTFVSR